MGPYTGTGGDIWTRPFYNLSPHAGSTVQIAFLFQSRTDVFGRARVSTGWYLDDFIIEGIPSVGIAVNPDTLDFGDVKVEDFTTENIRVSSTGSEILTMTSIELSGSDADRFEVDTTPFTLDPGTNKLLAVRFTPRTRGTFNAVLTLDSNGGTESVNLSGGGVGIIASNPIYMGGGLASGYDIGLNTSGGRTDWITENNDAICMAYPSGQAWGAVFITVGEPRDPPRPSQDLSAFQKLSLELRGENGGETVLVGIKDRTDPDNGAETKIAVSNLTTDWQAFEFPLSDFVTADLTQLYVVTEFVFEQSTAATVCFRNIQYVTFGRPTLSAAPASLDFGDVLAEKDSTQQIRISNTGIESLNVNAKLSGHDADRFEVSPSSFTLASNASLELDVTFRPDSIDTFSAVLTLESDGDSLSVNLSGFASTAVATETDGAPSAFVVYGNFPNPFNPTTTIRFDLPEAAEVRLFVYDVLGREMQRINAGRRAAGTQHEIRIEASDLASGTYFYRIEMQTLRKTAARTGSFTLVR